MARSFLGGEFAGGESAWWRGDWIPYLKKKAVINNKSDDMQMHMMKASNNKNLFQKLVLFLYIFWLTKMKGLD